MTHLLPWKVIIGGALVGFAGYLLWKQGPTIRSSLPGLFPGPAGTRPPGAPAAPGAPSAPASGTTPFHGGKVQKILGNPLAFDQGTHYRLRYTELLLTPAQVDAALPGFSASGVGLTFYRNPGDLPSDWPSEFATQDDPDTHFAEGTWSGAPATIDRPQGLYQVWVT